MSVHNSLESNVSSASTSFTCPKCGHCASVAALHSEHGRLVRSYRCRAVHSLYMIFTGLIFLTVLPLLGYFAFNIQDLPIDWFNPSFGLIVAGITVGPMMVVAGLRNSTSKLDLYENGIVYSNGRQSWDCSYDDIKRIFTLDVNCANGLRFLLKDRTRLDAMFLSDQDRAANFVLSRLHFRQAGT